MRKTSQVVAQAFKAREGKTMGNTYTNGQAVFLHGNRIAFRWNDRLAVTLAGWNTPTTRERVNAVLQVMGKSAYFFQRAFVPYFKHEDGKVEAINSNAIFYV